MSSCLFCKIIDGLVPSEKVYEDEDVLVFKDINPAAPVHFLLVPKKHISTINDIEASDQWLIGKIFKVAADVAKAEGIAASGYRVVANCNKDGGQVVFHLHFHFLGGRSMTWPPG